MSVSVGASIGRIVNQVDKDWLHIFECVRSENLGQDLDPDNGMLEKHSLLADISTNQVNKIITKISPDSVRGLKTYGKNQDK